MLRCSAGVRGFLARSSPRPLLLGRRAHPPGSAESTGSGPAGALGGLVNDLGPCDEVGSGRLPRRLLSKLLESLTVRHELHGRVQGSQRRLDGRRHGAVVRAEPPPRPRLVRRRPARPAALPRGRQRPARRRRQRPEVQAEGPLRVSGVPEANARSARQTIRQLAFKQAKEQLLAESREPIPPGLEKRFQSLRRKYWDARVTLRRLPRQERPGPVPRAGAVRPGRHRRPGRALLRVLQQGRVELRLPDRRPRACSPRPATSPSARRTSITRWRSTRSSSGCGPTAGRASRSTRPASRWRPKGRPTTARRRSTCRRRGCAGSCSCRRR